jgi:phosphoribosylanthranilate isomerase
MIVQIYEIQDPYQAEKCLEAGVDHIGSVLPAEGQGRVESIREVCSLLERTEVKHCIIPLFSGADEIYRALDYYKPAFVHLCDELAGKDGRMVNVDRFLEFQAAVREKFPEIGIIRTIPVSETEGTELASVETAKKFGQLSDVILVDTWSGESPVAGYIGITGKTADINISREVVEALEIPVIQAGGLDHENVFETAVKITPAGVDSCTGTNLTDEKGRQVRFKKDFEKVKTFVAEARRAGAEMEARLQEENARLNSARAELEELENALPAHSVKPSHMLRIEELEDQVSSLERVVAVLGRAVARSL